MITYVYGDIFYSPARVLVNPVNTVGAMGSGLAYNFKRFFPDMFEQYRDLCQHDAFDIGQLLLYRSPHKWILNFPTKRHFRAVSKLEYLEDGLKRFARLYADLNMTSISFPALGTGEGGLDWDEVRPLMEAYLEPLPIQVYIHLLDEALPNATKQKSSRATRSWLNAQPRIVSFEEFWKTLLKIVRREKGYENAIGYMPFKVVATQAKGRQRLSMKIMPKRADSIYLTESQLRDLWQYIRRVAYVLPQNMPAGLEAHAKHIMTLLVQMPMLRSVELARPNGDRVIGLHYIPPSDHKLKAMEVDISS
jgi:O-acetyl-ADP-ribose deacetylase (regulator of RNase III)